MCKIPSITIVMCNPPNHLKETFGSQNNKKKKVSVVLYVSDLLIKQKYKMRFSLHCCLHSFCNLAVSSSASTALETTLDFAFFSTSVSTYS